jgi:hypothetical protein
MPCCLFFGAGVPLYPPSIRWLFLFCKAVTSGSWISTTSGSWSDVWWCFSAVWRNMPRAAAFVRHSRRQRAAVYILLHALPCVAVVYTTPLPRTARTHTTAPFPATAPPHRPTPPTLSPPFLPFLFPFSSCRVVGWWLVPWWTLPLLHTTLPPSRWLATRVRGTRFDIRRLFATSRRGGRRTPTILRVAALLELTSGSGRGDVFACVSRFRPGRPSCLRHFRLRMPVTVRQHGNMTSADWYCA